MSADATLTTAATATTNDTLTNTTPASTTSTSTRPSVIVEVEEDPVMKEQLEDQIQKASVIAEFRSALASTFKEYPQLDLVLEVTTGDPRFSDRVAWRFLRARKFDVEKAATLFRDAVKMRIEKKLDGCLAHPIAKGLEYKIVSRHGWHGYDKYGRPIFIKNTGMQNFPALYSTGELKDRVDYNTYMNEYLRKVIIPEANARIGHKYMIDQVVTIVNLKDFGWHCIKKHNYDWVQQIALINNTLYPESAGSTWIINAPRVFSMVWSIVKGWLDERTRAKVQILSGDGRDEIRRVLGDETFRNLPLEIGGECNNCMAAESVPQFGSGCMLGHPMSVRFIEFMKARNTEAGIDNHPSLDASKFKDQPEDHDEPIPLETSE